MSRRQTSPPAAHRRSPARAPGAGLASGARARRCLLRRRSASPHDARERLAAEARRARRHARRLGARRRRHRRDAACSCAALVDVNAIAVDPTAPRRARRLRHLAAGAARDDAGARSATQPVAAAVRRPAVDDAALTRRRMVPEWIERRFLHGACFGACGRRRDGRRRTPRDAAPPAPPPALDPQPPIAGAAAHRSWC
mgnify:CR=1 FL=1